MTGILGDLALLGGGLVTVALAILGYGKVQKRKGREDAKGDAIRDANDRVEAGRDALRHGRDGEPDERVSGNDDRW